jgi:hypothetical protein
MERIEPANRLMAVAVIAIAAALIIAPTSQAGQRGGDATVNLPTAPSSR